MKKRTKVVAIVAASVLLAGTATGAFAYWSAFGGGSGSAITSSGPSAITVNQLSVLSPMQPGDSPQLLSGDFDNPGTPAYVDDVVATIASVTVTAPTGGCDASDFTLSNATMPVNAEIASGTGVGTWSGATIQFNDKTGVDQDGCIGATVNLAYSID
jgi:hypothetical protein